ncbi:hypothetical protein J2T08_003085 [Neorhizobium galegae]|uniref:hypothetical protein n=1 Tax=Neorhizobium galegae TaxID=399 RepID=UPI001AE50CB4|nr:hypothetical protein [Neorhizobium galegae]MBP2559261.1 hypothetical protein [Neorhizobium galegae]MDQ0135164.1 hypothetical protein [Neorhizobium galegae]
MLGDAGVTLESGQIAAHILPPWFLSGVEFPMLAVRGAGQRGSACIRADRLSRRG